VRRRGVASVSAVTRDGTSLHVTTHGSTFAIDAAEARALAFEILALTEPGDVQGGPATRAQGMADVILRDILSGRLLDGHELKEAELAARFGVSRTPVREALMQLANAGLIVKRAHHPCRVSAAAKPPGRGS